MTHTKYLCQMPQVKGDASSLRKLINHVSSHMNAIQALALNVPFQDLMLNHLMTATLDETHAVGAGHRNETGHACDIRAYHLSRGTLQSIGTTSKHKVSEDNYCPSTRTAISWN
jgi:hypothetical protein